MAGGLLAGLVLDTTATLAGGGLPSALGAHGGLVVEGVTSGVPVPVADGGASLTFDSTQLPSGLGGHGGLVVEGVASGVAIPISHIALPAALGAHGGLIIEGAASGVAVPISHIALPSALGANGGLQTDPVGPVPAEVVYLTSASRGVTQTQGDQTNTVYSGIRVIVDVTTPGTGSITLSIQAKDPASGKYVTMLAGAAIVTQVTNTYLVYPGALNTANVSASDRLPKTWRLLVTANNGNVVTYTVGYVLLP